MTEPESISAATYDQTADQAAGLPNQIEIPYIPAAQRRQTNIIDDSIVIVGQARQKKRKRVKASSADIDPDSAAVSAMDTEIFAEASHAKAPKKQGRGENGSATHELFDYSAVPNILDDVPTPEHDTTSRRKKKQKQNNGEPVPVYVGPYLPAADLQWMNRWCFGVWQLSCTTKSSPGA